MLPDEAAVAQPGETSMGEAVPSAEQHPFSIVAVDGVPLDHNELQGSAGQQDDSQQPACATASADRADAAGAAVAALVAPQAVNPAANAPMATSGPLLGRAIAGRAIAGRYLVFFHSNVSSTRAGLTE